MSVGEDAGNERQRRTRIAVRITAAFIARSMTCFAKAHHGELITALISLAIIQANNVNIDRNQSQPPRYLGIGDVPPDKERRPVSVLAVSRAVGLPVETTRRHVRRLIERGHCHRVKGGILVNQMPVDELHAETLLEVNVLVRRFMRQLEWAGINSDP
jgi:hypothetical protein